MTAQGEAASASMCCGAAQNPPGDEPLNQTGTHRDYASPTPATDAKPATTPVKTWAQVAAHVSSDPPQGVEVQPAASAGPRRVNGVINLCEQLQPRPKVQVPRTQKQKQPQKRGPEFTCSPMSSRNSSCNASISSTKTVVLPLQPAGERTYTYAEVAAKPTKTVEAGKRRKRNPQPPHTSPQAQASRDQLAAQPLGSKESNPFWALRAESPKSRRASETAAPLDSSIVAIDDNPNVSCASSNHGSEEDGGVSLPREPTPVPNHAGAQPSEDQSVNGNVTPQASANTTEHNGGDDDAAGAGDSHGNANIASNGDFDCEAVRSLEAEIDSWWTQKTWAELEKDSKNQSDLASTSDATQAVIEGERQRGSHLTSYPQQQGIPGDAVRPSQGHGISLASPLFSTFKTEDELQQNTPFATQPLPTIQQHGPLNPLQATHRHGQRSNPLRLSAGYHQTSPRRPATHQPAISGTTTCSAQQFPPEKYQTCPPIREYNGQAPHKTAQHKNANPTVQPPMSLQDLFNRFGNQSGSTKPSEAKKSYFPGDWTPPLGSRQARQPKMLFNESPAFHSPFRQRQSQLNGGVLDQTLEQYPTLQKRPTLPQGWRPPSTPGASSSIAPSTTVWPTKPFYQDHRAYGLNKYQTYKPPPSSFPPTDNNVPSLNPAAQTFTPGSLSYFCNPWAQQPSDVFTSPSYPHATLPTTVLLNSRQHPSAMTWWKRVFSRATVGQTPWGRTVHATSAGSHPPPLPQRPAEPLQSPTWQHRTQEFAAAPPPPAPAFSPSRLQTSTLGVESNGFGRGGAVLTAATAADDKGGRRQDEDKTKSPHRRSAYGHPGVREASPGKTIGRGDHGKGLTEKMEDLVADVAGLGLGEKGEGEEKEGEVMAGRLDTPTRSECGSPVGVRLDAVAWGPGCPRHADGCRSVSPYELC